MRTTCKELHTARPPQRKATICINASRVINPPFIGQYTKSKEQTEDAKLVWGADYDGYLDYVTCWFKKSADFFAEVAGGRFAFVSTNSVAQGQPVPALFRPLFRDGWRIRFAHQTFPWTTEAADGAAVHCVITGYDKHEATPAQLYTYPRFGGEPVPVEAKNINGYLLDAPNIFADKRSKVLSDFLPSVSKGSQPTDDGNLIVEVEQYEAVEADDLMKPYLRRFVGARELIHSADRWCLWMADDPSFSEDSLPPFSALKKRIEGVRQMRLASKKAATRELAVTPHLFAERRQPAVPYVCIPSVVGEKREYFTAAHLSEDVVSSNLVFTCPDEDGFVFAIVSSSMFITWQRAVGGRLKSDLRFSNTLVWNNLPLPPVDEDLRRRIIDAGRGVLAARALYPDRSLAQQYEAGNLSPELQAAHDALDVVVDQAFGALSAPFTPDIPIHQRFASGTATNEDRLSVLFTRYQQLTS